MENTQLKILAIERSIEQIQKSLNEKNPHITISKYKTLPSLRCRFAESLSLRGHSGKVNSICWNKGNINKNRTLASVSSDGSIILWNTSIGQPIYKWYLKDHVLTTGVFEPIQGTILAVGSFEGKCFVYNTNISNELELKDTPITEFLAHEGYVSELVFFNSNQIITSSEDKSIKLWDVENPFASIHSFVDHSQDVMCVDTNENLIISGSCDHSAKLWDIRQNKLVRSFNIHLGDVNSVKFISGYSFITGCADGFMRLLDIRGLNVLGYYKAGNKIESVESSFSGRVLFTAGETGDVKVWDIMIEHSPVQILPRNSACVKLCNDAVYLAGAFEDNVILWQHVLYSS